MAVGVDGIVDLVQQVFSVAGDEVDACDGALLQSLVGIERLRQHFSVTANEGAFQRFGASGLLMEFFELVLHLRPGRFGSVEQRLV